MSYSFKNLIVSAIGETLYTVALNRPQCANALDSIMALEIKDFFGNLPTGVRVVILTGQGMHFCAGADLKERKNMSETQWHEQHAAFEAARDAILACAIPVIAAVNGAAFGGGLELALACDYIYAADNAHFALTEVTLGIMPGLGGTQMLPRSVGMAQAKEILFTGKPFSAEEACRLGMINRIFTAENMLNEAILSAKTIQNNAPLAIKAVKKAVNEGINAPLTQAFCIELEQYNALLSTHDRHEGINAFNEKRKPSFSGT